MNPNKRLMKSEVTFARSWRNCRQIANHRFPFSLAGRMRRNLSSKKRVPTKHRQNCSVRTSER